MQLTLPNVERPISQVNEWCLTCAEHWNTYGTCLGYAGGCAKPGCHRPAMPCLGSVDAETGTSEDRETRLRQGYAVQAGEPMNERATVGVSPAPADYPDAQPSMSPPASTGAVRRFAISNEQSAVNRADNCSLITAQCVRLRLCGAADLLAEAS